MPRLNKAYIVSAAFLGAATSWGQSVPANDDFINALVITNTSGMSAAVNTAEASAEPREPAHAKNHGPFHSVWWKYTAPADGGLFVDTWASDESFDTVLGIYTNSGGNAVSNLIEVASNDDNDPGDYFRSKTGAAVRQGQTYWIAVDGYDETATGNAVLSWNFQDPPANDHFTNATVLAGTSGVSATVNTVFATAEPGEPHHANIDPFHSVWWKYTAPTNATLILDTLDSDADLDTVLGVYTNRGEGAVSSLEEVIYNNNDPDQKTDLSRVVLDVVQGTDYWIAADEYSEEYTGGVVLNWELVPRDSDGDGVSYMQEWIADTDPDDPEDRFHLSGFDGVSISFESSSKRNYALYCSTNLVAGSWYYLLVQPGSGGPDSFTVTPNSSCKFFKVIPVFP